MPPGSVAQPFFMTRSVGSSGSYSAIAGTNANFAEDQEIIIQSETDGTIFYYATGTGAVDDITDPNHQSGATLFSSLLTLSGSGGAQLSIKAIGLKSLMYPSSVGGVTLTRQSD